LHVARGTARVARRASHVSARCPLRHAVPDVQSVRCDAVQRDATQRGAARTPGGACRPPSGRSRRSRPCRTRCTPSARRTSSCSPRAPAPRRTCRRCRSLAVSSACLLSARRVVLFSQTRRRTAQLPPDGARRSRCLEAKAPVCTRMHTRKPACVCVCVDPTAEAVYGAMSVLSWKGSGDITCAHGTASHTARSFLSLNAEALGVRASVCVNVCVRLTRSQKSASTPGRCAAATIRYGPFRASICNTRECNVQHTRYNVQHTRCNVRTTNRRFGRSTDRFRSGTKRRR
jgi:hypothetical protein